MSSDEGGSVTCWLGHLREGDLSAAQPLWERYFSRLVVVARGKLKKLRRTRADQDEEDAALSAFNSFCDGAARGRFTLKLTEGVVERKKNNQRRAWRKR